VSPWLTAFQHEWFNHGTCYSTLRPSCLPPGSPRGAEAVAYFKRVVELFQQLPTYQWLKASGIVPNERAQYDFDDIINALRASSGVRCTRSSSTFALIGSVHRLLQPLNARRARSRRSAGISTSRGHSSMATSSLSVREMIHTVPSVMLIGKLDSPKASECGRGPVKYIPKVLA
jgi:hypothetical protein